MVGIRSCHAATLFDPSLRRFKDLDRLSSRIVWTSREVTVTCSEDGKYSDIA